MAIKTAINGFGRIGRLALRAIIENNREDILPVLVNTPASVETNAHLLKYDSIHGRFEAEIKTSQQGMEISYKGKKFPPIRFTAEKDSTVQDLAGIDVMMECSGLFGKSGKVAELLKTGVKKILVSAPAEGVEATVVYGVNHQVITPTMKLVSNASCTTNCLAPMAKVLEEEFGILRGYMLTIHSYTRDQRLTDSTHSDLHRARAAALSQIPTTTGAAKAVGLVLPSLKGKLDGSSVRVPTANVSMVSLDVNLKKAVSKEEINQALQKASEGELKGVLAYCQEKLVSTDFNHTEASCYFDATQTAVVDGGAMAHVVGWYDNEWAFACRMLDTAVLMGTL